MPLLYEHKFLTVYLKDDGATGQRDGWRVNN